MAASNGKRPNIVIFMMDTQGARNMSCYGYRRPTTPNIDQIAAEGVLFENHFVTGPWTLPVHSSLFTGRYESGHGAGAQHEGLKPVPPYIPSDNPNEKDKGSLKLVGVATKWIDDNYVANPDKPFLMFINCTEPHDAYLPPEPFRSRFLLDGVTYEEAVARKGGQAVSTMGDKCLTIDEWAMQRSLYDGSTACLDDRIGKFVGELKKRGVYDDTIFIVTGDHGDVQGEQVWYAYHSQNGVWDGTVKTPLVMRYPKKFAAGTRCKELVQINDIFPALMELAGIQDADASASIQGENLLRALEGATREFALIEAQRAIHVMRRSWTEAEDPETLDVRFANVWYKAARTLEWKYVWASNGQDMLFNIQRDPDERWNVIDRYPEIARDLMRKMETKLMSMEQRYFTDMFKPTNRKSHQPKVTRRLAAWGLYQPGIVPPYDPKAQEEWEKEFPG